MWMSCALRSGLLCVSLSLAIAKHGPSQPSFSKSCYSRELLSQAVDTLYVKAGWLKATVPNDCIKNVRLLKKRAKKLFMKSCRFQEQLLSFFMQDVFGQLQLQIYKEKNFVEDFYSLRQKLSRCADINEAAMNIIYKSLERDFGYSWISCASSAKEMTFIVRMKKTFYRIGNKGISKAISELDILLSWIKELLENIQ